jgi:hypothetical protein
VVTCDLSPFPFVALPALPCVALVDDVPTLDREGEAVKKLIVNGLDWLCERTHWITHHRPVIWFVPVCWLALKSSELDERWGTEQWKPVKP